MKNANECYWALVKNTIKKNFDIIFMKNEKNCQNIIFFFIKTFFD